MYRTLGYIAVAIIALGVAGYALHNWEMMDPAQLALKLQGFGAWGPLLVIVLMVLHSFVPIPAEVLALAAGAVFGTFAGAIIVWIGAMLGAIISYWIAYRFGAAGLRRWLPKRHLKTLDHWTQNPSPLALLIARFVPVIAFNAINYAAGLARIPFGMFIWTTAIGITPIVLLSTYLGSEMRGMSWSMILTLSAVFILLSFATWAVAKKIWPTKT